MKVVSTLSVAHGTSLWGQWLITVTHDIELTVLHISSMANGLTDLLSLWYSSGLNREVMNNLLALKWCTVNNSYLELNDTI